MILYCEVITLGKYRLVVKIFHFDLGLYGSSLGRGEGVGRGGMFVDLEITCTNGSYKI